MKKRRVIVDSDEEEEAAVVSLSSPEDTTKEEVTLEEDSWLEKRDSSSMTASQKQINIEKAREKKRDLIQKKKKTSSPLIKSRHTSRINDSNDENNISNGLVAQYDLRNALLSDTPEKKDLKSRMNGVSRLKRNREDRSVRREQRQATKESQKLDNNDEERKKEKKEKKQRHGGDEDGDNYQYIDVGQDMDSDAEEEKRKEILEQKSREVISRCSELSNTLRKVLQSWQQGSVSDDSNVKDCVSLLEISCQDQERLLHQRDISNMCPNLELKDYQLVGLNWLKLLHQNDVNGVLADDMGLGKTIQTIAFLGWMHSNRQTLNGNNDTQLAHLIVVPASTLANWCNEFEKFCPSLKVMKFHGNQIDKEELKHQLRRAFIPKYQPPGGVHEDDRIDVVITTYTMFERQSGAEDRSFLRKLPFEYLVLDEAHCIKNSASSRYVNLRGLKPRRRLLLSGTPVQNDVRELLALLSFLMPKVFRVEYIDFLYDSFIAGFNQENSSNSSSSNDSQLEADRNNSSLQELRCMLAPFVLRRVKTDVLRQMTPKIEVPLKMQMTERQASLYESIISKHLLKSDGATVDEATPLVTNLSSTEASNIFFDLRKASNHPLLLRTRFGKEELDKMTSVCCAVAHFGDQCDRDRVYSELLKFSDFDLNYLCLEYPSFLGDLQLSNEVLYDSPKMVRLKSLLPQLIGDDHRILIFSQWTKMMDILGALLGDLGYSFLRLDGTTPVRERQRLIDKFEKNTSIPIFLLSTRAGGLGINLTAADTVILHDLDFNPENDRQAEDRCHRIGQNRTVTVYKLVTLDSVDESIYDMGEKKKRLSRAVLEGSKDDSSSDTKEINQMLQQALQRAVSGLDIISLHNCNDSR